MKSIIASIMLALTLATAGLLPTYEGTSVPDLEAINPAATEIAVFEAVGIEADEGFCLYEYELQSEREATATCAIYWVVVDAADCERVNVRTFSWTEDDGEHYGVAVTVFLPSLVS